MEDSDHRREKTPPELGWLVPALIILGLALWAFPALDQYNVTWDEALGDLFFGERYLAFFTSGDPVYLDFERNPYPPDRSPDLFRSYFKIRPWEYYPVANTLAAATSTVLARWLGWLDPFDGFHAVNVLLAALLVWVFHRFLNRQWGLVTATAAVGLLLGSPRVFCHLMANVKDFPLMVLFTLTVVAFLRPFEAGSVRGLLGAGVVLGLALGTKANALFFPAIPVLLLVLGGIPESWRGRRRALFLTLLAAGLVALVVMVALWPYLWPDPVGRFSEHLRYIGLRKTYSRPESAAPVLQAILLTTPPAFLALFAVGLGPCLRRAWRRERPALVLLVWMAVVLGRFLLPQAVNFDGVRHFLELFPAMAAVAGLGAAWLGAWVVRLVPAVAPQRLKAAVLVLLLLPGAWAVVRTHPFQIAYWNVLTGGFAGAWSRGLPQAGDYWGMSYRLGMEWLNANAPPDSALAVPVVEHAVYLVAPVRLRPDLLLLPVTTPYSPRIAPDRLRRTREMARERPVYVMFVERRDWMNELMADCLNHLHPVMEWQLEGTPVLRIYRYQPPMPCCRKSDDRNEAGIRSLRGLRSRPAEGGKAKEAEALGATTPLNPYLRSRNRASLDLVKRQDLSVRAGGPSKGIKALLASASRRRTSPPILPKTALRWPVNVRQDLASTQGQGLPDAEIAGLGSKVWCRRGSMPP